MAGSNVLRRWLIPGAILVVAALVGSGAVLVLVSKPAGASVTLEPAASLGVDPFTASVTIGEIAEFPDTIRAITVEVTDGLEPDPDTGGLEAQGATPGLYGGTRDESVCDPDRLAGFLAENPDKATAWAGVLGIGSGDIGDYIAGLTPMVLTTDTLVTNHGFADGAATPRQSVLQAGTAVLIDDRGVPRVKCGCGNPLTEPAPTLISATSGDSWSDYQADTVTTIIAADEPATTFTVTDLVTGDEFARLAGTYGTDDFGAGDVQVTLTWTGPADVDLHVIEPTGNEIFFGNRTSASGGALDVDDIPDCSETGSHVENVFWPRDGAPSGDYSAFVRVFAIGCETGLASFTLTVKVAGEVVAETSGNLDARENSETVTFNT